MSAAIASGSGADISQALGGLASSLVGQLAGTGQGVPTFVTLLGALLVVFGAFVLWVELLVRGCGHLRGGALPPLGLASLVWPAVAHWCRRLVDTLAALILSKFVIVAVLSLAASALASGTPAGVRLGPRRWRPAPARHLHPLHAAPPAAASKWNLHLIALASLRFRP